MTLLRSIVPGFGRPARTSSETPATSTEARLKPAYNVREDEHGYDLTVQLPGVAKSGLEITAQDGVITIMGRRAWIQPTDWIALYRETPRANFELTLSHGGEVDAEKIGAELKDGILHLTLPKAEAAKPRKIAVS
jgi:HSP20 family molecular chaperone IbpA